MQVDLTRLLRRSRKIAFYSVISHNCNNNNNNKKKNRETSFLYQRISILVQRFNAVLLHDSCRLLTAQIEDHTTFLISHLIFELPRDYIYRGLKKNICSSP